MNFGTSFLSRFWPKLAQNNKVTTSITGLDGDGVPTIDIKDIQKLIIKDSDIIDAEQQLRNRNTSNILTSILGEPKITKAEYMEAVDEIKEYDLAESIIENVAKDVLTKDVDKNIKNKYFTVSLAGEHPELEKECQQVINNFELSLLLKDYMDDILWYGEYVFDIHWKDKTVEDKENQSDLIPLFGRSRFKYLSDESILMDSKDYLVFRMSSMDKKLIFKVKQDDNTYNDIKFFIRPSKGLFSINVINKLRILKLLESLIPINEMTNLSRKMQFYMRVPMGTQPADAFSQCRKYEIMIKSLLKFESPDDSPDLLQRLLDVRVIPLFGDQTELTEGNIPKPEKVDLSYINDIRESLVATTNIPRRFIFPNDDSPLSASYLRLLQHIREEVLGNGVRHIVYEYLHKVRRNPVKFDFNDIYINVPKIQGISELDTLEYSQMFNQSLTDLNRLIDEGGKLIQDAPSTINKEELVAFLNEKMKVFTDRAIFKLPDPEPDNSDDMGY